MAATFDWDDAEEIGIQLAEKYPDSDPLSVRYTDLLFQVRNRPGRIHWRSQAIQMRASWRRFRWHGWRSITREKREG